MTKAVFFLADGFEELEYVAPWDILRRAGIDVLTVSIHNRCEVVSARGMKILSDLKWSDAWEPAEILVLPGGGGGTANLRSHLGVLDAIRHQIERQALVAAICAAPLVLGDAGILTKTKVTCYPSVVEELKLKALEVCQDRVVESGLVITSRGAGTAADFGFALVTKLIGITQAQKIRAQMVFE